MVIKKSTIEHVGLRIGTGTYLSKTLYHNTINVHWSISYITKILYMCKDLSYVIDTMYCIKQWSYFISVWWVQSLLLKASPVCVTVDVYQIMSCVYLHILFWTSLHVVTLNLENVIYMLIHLSFVVVINWLSLYSYRCKSTH